MEELTGPAYPPGDYPVVVVGSGPGGLQLSYSLRRHGVEHALLSADDAPGGMFRRWPIFQRMLSWTKPYAPVDRRSVPYERFDWNSLIPDDDGLRGIQGEFMDGSNEFPARPEMQQGLEAFAERAGIAARYGCRWESTRAEGDGFVLTTSDGEYRCRVAVFAVGVAQPWRPPIPGMDAVPHYGEMSGVDEYRDKRVFIVGKKNSGFEIANGLLAVARQIVLASPSPALTSLETHNLMGIRARYAQPMEENAVGGSVYAINAKIDEVRRQGSTFQVRTTSTDHNQPWDFVADAVIAATGFQAPLGDLPDLGVSVFGQSRLPVQTAYWESSSVPGIFFAGTLSQGAQGLKKFGIAANSGAVHGARYNARVLAEHLATRHFGKTIERPLIAPADAVAYLIGEVNSQPALFHQRSYLVRVLAAEPSGGLRDRGMLPLTDFLDNGPDNAVAITLEANAEAQIYPVLYARGEGGLVERQLAPGSLLNFDSEDNRRAVAEVISPLLSATARA